MSDTRSEVPSYTLRKLVSESRRQIPRLVQGRKAVIPGLSGRDRIDGRTRLLVQLRMARLMGCPVCVGLFPPLARRAGLSEEAIRSGLEGSPAGLKDEQHAALSWVGELIRNDGAEPAQVPAGALALSEAQRKHLLFFARMELLVHATGLMFLPHRWVQRAHRG